MSGGEPKAIDGTLAIMAGGDAGSSTRVLPILQKMGSSVTLTGRWAPATSPSSPIRSWWLATSPPWARRWCWPRGRASTPEVVFNAVKGGLAGSTVLNAKAPMVIARNFKPGFRIRLHQKDLRNALLAAESMKVALPLTSLVQQMLIALMNEARAIWITRPS